MVDAFEGDALDGPPDDCKGSGTLGRAEDGFAVIVAMMGLLMIGALGMALVLTTSIESMIARNFRDGAVALYAADAAASHAVAELSRVADWTTVFTGWSQSTFFDGTSRTRILDDGSNIDLEEILNLANCGQLTACSEAEMAAIDSRRPWGLNNPRWRIFACGRLTDLLGLPSRFYVVLLVADDPSETDGDPLTDGAGLGNPGSGMLTLRSEAFGPGGAHGIVEMTVARNGPGGPAPGEVRVVSWRAGR